MSERDVLRRRACRVVAACGGVAGLVGLAGAGKSVDIVPQSWGGTVTITTSGLGGAQPTGCDTDQTVTWAGQSLAPGSERVITAGMDAVNPGDFSCLTDLAWTVEVVPTGGSVAAGATTFDINALASLSADITSLWTAGEWASGGTLGGRVELTGVVTASALATVTWELTGPLAPDGRNLAVYSYATPVMVDEPAGLITVDGVPLTDGLAPGSYELRLVVSASEESPFVNFGSGIELSYELDRTVDGVSGPVPMCGGGMPCGDLNGDGQTTLADVEDWVVSPVDTTGDGTADPDPLGDDAAFLVAQLLAIGAIDPTDCDGNSYPDAYDIVAGLATDFDNNGVPDSCDPPPPCNAADLAPPFFVLDIDDVLTFLQAFSAGNLDIADIAGGPAPRGGGGGQGPDGELDIDDVLYFLQTFDLGCFGESD